MRRNFRTEIKEKTDKQLLGYIEYIKNVVVEQAGICFDGRNLKMLSYAEHIAKQRGLA